MKNGQTDGAGLIIPAPVEKPPERTLKTCHRFFAPVVLPEMDPLNPRKVNVTPRLGNFPCIEGRCALWNAEKSECWDVSAARGQATAGEYAFNLMNDVHIENGGA